MPTHTTAAALLAAGLLLTGCSSSGDAKPKPTVSTLEPADSEPTTEEPTEETVETYPIGEAMSWGNDSDTLTGNTTVLGYQQPVTSVGSAEEEAGEKGYVWAALEAKVCVDTGSLTVSGYDWTLAYEDGARVEQSSSTYGDFPKPEFPTETDVRAGDCVRGKVVYPVPGGKQPEKVIYAPNGDSEALAEWAVPKP